MTVAVRAMKECGKEEIQLHVFLNWSLRGVSCHIQVPAALPLWKEPAIRIEYKGLDISIE
jgi:hypothetical protein